MAVTKPPITGDEELDSFNDQLVNELNTGLLAAGTTVDNTTRVVGTGIAAVPVDVQVNAGINHATISLFQRTSLNNANGLTPPDEVRTTLRYNYSTLTLRSQNGEGNFLVGPPWDGWYDYITERDPVAKDDYVWRQTINIADRAPTETIAPTQWSQVGLFTRPGLGALRTTVEYTQIRGLDDVTKVGETIVPPMFNARVASIRLGEVDIAPQIDGSMICWIISEDDGTFRVDSKFMVDDDGNYIVNNPTATPIQVRDSDGKLETVTPTYIVDEVNGVAFNSTLAVPPDYVDINFAGGNPRRTSYMITFREEEIFSINEGDGFSETSRDIEPRINISNVINI